MGIYLNTGHHHACVLQRDERLYTHPEASSRRRLCGHRLLAQAEH